MDLDGLIGFVLVLVRVASILAFLPFLGEHAVPALVKVLLSLAVALVVWPASGVSVSAQQASPLSFTLWVLAEALYGVLLGFTARALFLVLQSGGEFMGRQMGLVLAEAAAPLDDSEAETLGTMCEVIGVLVFFLLGGHHVMLWTVRESFAQWRVGAFLSPDFIKSLSLGAAAQHLVMAFQLAAPLVVLAFLSSLVLAVLERLVPEMNVLMLAFPLRIGLALGALALLTPLIVQYAAALSRGMVRAMAEAAAGGG